MVRISKQGERRNVSPRRSRPPAPKTGRRKENLPGGFKSHANAVVGDSGAAYFISKIA